MFSEIRLILFSEDTTIKELQINGQIRDKEVRLVGQDGEQLGIMSAMQAQSIANESELDLVKISPMAVPPVCKIMDYGKYRFDAIKKEKEAKKNQKVVELKEIRLSMTIDSGDLVRLARQCDKFITEGNKVKVSIRMRGRQMAHQEMGVNVMVSFYALLTTKPTQDKKPFTEGRNITMMLSPVKA